MDQFFSLPDRTPHDESPLRVLVAAGLKLAAERSVNGIVHVALEAGLQLSGAQFGTFCPNDHDTDDELTQNCRWAGVDDPTFEPPVLPLAVLRQIATGRETIRSAKVSADPHLQELAAAGSESRLCSCLIVPLVDRADEVVGGLFYGHAENDVFTAELERWIGILANQAATAIDHIRLAETVVHEVAQSDAARKLQRQTAHRLRQALEAAQLGTWTWDRRTDLLDLDKRASELFQTPPNTPVTRTALRESVVRTEDAPETLERLRQSLENGGLYSAEYRVLIPGGFGSVPANFERWIAASGIATYAPGSTQVTGMIGTVQDVTARKSHEATLRESEKLAATGRLAATIAHEINNPLEAVTNLIYLCKTDPGVPAEVQRLLETADGELARVAQIAQQTLGFYRDTTRPVAIDLSQLLHSIVDLFARKMVSHRIMPTLDIEPGLKIFGLQGEMRQVFSNLLVNAIDAATGGSISIRARCHPRADGTARISVLMLDDGTGIPAEVRARLFSPFFTTKQSVGTGLGLWVTRGIVEKQGGTIGFRSRTGAHSGTIFRVSLRAGSQPSQNAH